MDKKPESIQHLNGVLKLFLRARHEHRKRNWFGLRPLARRYWDEDKEYPTLQSADMSFFLRIQLAFRENMERIGTTTEELEDFLYALKGHICRLELRRSSLMYLGLALAAILVVVPLLLHQADMSFQPKFETVATILSTLGLLVILERAQNREWVSGYEEFVLLIEHEIHRKENDSTHE